MTRDLSNSLNLISSVVNRLQDEKGDTFLSSLNPFFVMKPPFDIFCDAPPFISCNMFNSHRWYLYFFFYTFSVTFFFFFFVLSPAISK